jgi:hypothetical protein
MGPLLLRKRKRISSIRALRWRAAIIRRNELALAAKKASHDDDNRGAYYQDHYDYDDDEEEEKEEEGEEEDGDGDGDREGDEDELDDGIRIQAQEEEWMEKDEVVEDEEDEAEIDNEEIEAVEMVSAWSTLSTVTTKLVTAERVHIVLSKKHLESTLLRFKVEVNFQSIKLTIDRYI